MKLSITQTVLGALILLAAACIAGWMIFGAQSLLNMPVPDESGIMRDTEVFPKYEALFTAARYASGLLLGLGLVVILTGASRKTVENAKKLAIRQIVAGALITAASIFINIWGCPTVFIVPMPAGNNLSRFVSIYPGLPMTGAMYLTILTILLGMAVLGVGIAQLVKARK